MVTREREVILKLRNRVNTKVCECLTEPLTSH